MAYPAKAKTWVLFPNNRIVFVSLNDTMSKFLFGVKQWLKIAGYTIAGSSNGVTGAMDGVDRWVTAANATTRGAGAGNAQSWIVLTDGNGVQILLDYQGASDDVARIAMAPLADYVAAGTPQNQPTATSERVILTSLSLINNTTNTDRVWFGWVDSTNKLFRVAIARAGVWIGQLWGVELVSSAVVSGTITASWSPAVWGFGLQANVGTYSSASIVGVARPVTSGTGRSPSIQWMAELLGNLSTNDTICNSKSEMQGATGFIVIPLSIGSTTASCNGKLGDLFDAYAWRPSGALDGVLEQSKLWIGMGGFRAAGSGAMLWPWDGVTTPQLY